MCQLLHRLARPRSQRGAEKSGGDGRGAPPESQTALPHNPSPFIFGNGHVAFFCGGKTEANVSHEVVFPGYAGLQQKEPKRSHVDLTCLELMQMLLNELYVKNTVNTEAYRCTPGRELLSHAGENGHGPVFDGAHGGVLKDRRLLGKGFAPWS